MWVAGLTLQGDDEGHDEYATELMLLTLDLMDLFEVGNVYEICYISLQLYG